MLTASSPDPIPALTVEPPVPALVLDTNAVLDWLLFGDPSMAAIGNAIQAHEVRWMMSPAMRAELAHVLGRGCWERWHADAPSVLQAVQHRIHSVAEPHACSLHCTDPDDQVFIDLALAQGARWLVTRDKALLRLRRQAALRGTAVCRPSDWRPVPPT